MQILSSQTGFVARVINNRLFQHLTYWVAFVIFFAFAWGTHDDNYLKTVEIELINLPVKVALVYGVIYLLFPRYLYTGKIGRFITIFLGFLFMASALQRVTDNLIIVDTFFPEWDKHPPSTLCSW